MGENSRIAWTQHTWNPWVGCTPVSAGCDHCYMAREQRRFGHDPAVVRRTSADTWRQPMRWQSALDHAYRVSHRAADRTQCVFTCSWSDFFHPAADGWRADAWDVIRETTRDAIPAAGGWGGLPRAHLTWLILTKRPERILECLPADWGDGWPHVWLGVTAETQEQADRRVLQLLWTPAMHRFVSLEPLLEPVELGCDDAELGWINYLRPPRLNGVQVPGIDWVIVGGETGPSARPMQSDWARTLREQCIQAHVPFCFKQHGNWWCREYRTNPTYRENHELDGRIWRLGPCSNTMP
jgi:protein gp37